MPIDLVSHLVSAAIRAFVPGLFAFAGLWLFRIRSPGVRHATWTVVLAGMLLQIPLGLVAPAIPVKTLPMPPAPALPRAMESARISRLMTPAPPPASHTQTEPKRLRISSGGTLAGLYLVISMLLFVRMALGSWSLRRILRDSRPLPELGPDGIFESALFVVPGSVGCFRGKIFLPPAWRDWDAAKLRAVLAHERAHIRRHDCLIRVASHVNVCVFWFHPLAWWLEREIARLAEEACDDVARSAMQDNEEYAAALVDIARVAAAGRRVLNWRMISMARDSNVMRRVNRILETGLPVPKPLGRLAWVTLLACSLPVIYLSAAVTLTPANRNSTVPVEQVTVAAPPAEQEPPIQPAIPAPPIRPTRSEDPPITLCILIDNSGSMRNKREGVKAAALALVKASHPGDEVCIVNFNDEVSGDLPFTSDMKEMEEALTYIDSRGGSAMRDAVRMSIDQVEQAAHNAGKVLVLITDGDDNASNITQEQLLGKVRNSGVRVYSIALLNGAPPRRADSARLALGQLAEASGGMVYYPGDLAEVESLAPDVANELRAVSRDGLR